jgi:hypothetical protein
MPDYFQMITRLDDYMFKNRSKVTKPTGEKTSFASETIFILVSTIISLGIFASVFFTLTFAINLIHNIYPSCWFVRNMGIMPLWLNFLGGPGFLGISWLLARTQHKLLTVDGVGMRLYGSEPVPNSEQYVSTKWLVLPGVPLIPVRSYMVIADGNGPLNQKTYKLQPLDKINWTQVKETIRKSWIGYGVLALIYIALITWALLECQ